LYCIVLYCIVFVSAVLFTLPNSILKDDESTCPLSPLSPLLCHCEVRVEIPKGGRCHTSRTLKTGLSMSSGD